MSLKTSNAMPVENYSVVQQSENGTQFSPLTKCRFRIPAHLGYVDFHTSYLQFNFEVKNAKGKMEFSNNMGADILLRTWRVLIGGHIIEEIDHPNVLLKTLKYDYGMDLGMEELNQVFNKQGDSREYQGFNSSDNTLDVSTTSPCEKVKCVLDLGFSGVFGSTQTFPVGLSGDVEIEIVWEEPRRCLQVAQAGIVPARSVDTHGNFNRAFACDNIASGGAITELKLKAEPGVSNSYFPNEGSFDNIKDVPFNVGQRVKVRASKADNSLYDENSTGEITAIALDVGQVKLTVNVGADPGQNLTNVAVSLAGTVDAAETVSWDNNNALTYEISVPTLCLQVVAPPPPYVEQQAQKVATEGLMIDVPTYTCYKANTFANIRSATIDIPCYASRAKGFLCVGVPEQNLGGQNLLTAPYQMRGDFNDLDTYQFQIGERREPVRPVNCGNLSTYQRNVAQEQLTELEKSLKASGGEVRSLVRHADNFVIGRALSLYGGTISLAMKGARLYLQYLQTDLRKGDNTTQSNKNWFNYCYHIRRLQITPQGVNVMY